MAEEEWRIRALDGPVLERSSPWLIELQEVKKSGVGGGGATLSQELKPSRDEEGENPRSSGVL